MYKLMLLCLILLLPGGCMIFNEQKIKSIEICVESTPNYLFHILSVAKIGYNNDYSEKYTNSLSASDKQTMKTSSRIVEIPSNYEYNFSWLIIFLPGYMNIEGEEFTEYYSELMYLFQSRDGSRFGKRYKKDLDNARKQFGDFWEYSVLNQLQSATDDDIKGAAAVCSVIVRNYDSYISEIWTDQEEVLQAKADSLNAFLSDFSPFEIISEQTGEHFDEEKFMVTLCSSIEKGPDAMDLGYNKNLHYYNRDNESLRHFITHELIIRYIIPYRNKFYRNYNNINHSLLYEVTEMTAEFYTNIILEDSFSFNWFPEIMTKLKASHKDHINIYDFMEKVYLEVLQENNK